LTGAVALKCGALPASARVGRRFRYSTGPSSLSPPPTIAARSAANRVETAPSTVGWASLNLLAGALGYRPIDPPPFSGLAGAVSLVSLYMVVLILTTQRREDTLAQHREQLILELALLSEQKTAKVIELLEEVRRDNPHIHDRIDEQADAMAQPSDPQQVLDAIRDIHAEAAQTAGFGRARPAAAGSRNEP